MTTITRYAIRHNPTGGYLPVPHGRGGRGGSHERTIVFPHPDRNPRMWPSQRGAKICLAVWLKGKVVCNRGGSDDDWWEDNELIPQPQRKAEEMEIVPITITLP